MRAAEASGRHQCQRWRWDVVNLCTYTARHPPFLRGHQAHSLDKHSMIPNSSSLLCFLQCHDRNAVVGKGDVGWGMWSQFEYSTLWSVYCSGDCLWRRQTIGVTDPPLSVVHFCKLLALLYRLLLRWSLFLELPLMAFTCFAWLLGTVSSAECSVRSIALVLASPNNVADWC